MLESLNKIEIEDPVDLIISQIRELIISGAVEPGQKLPPERKLAEHLGVSRGQVRDAINKLQIYGIVKVVPQSGTIVNGIGIVALEGLLTDILKIETKDLKGLVDTRILLEKEAARLAAIYRTTEDIAQMTTALSKYEKKLKSDGIAVEEDLLFHIKIAEAGKNTVLKSLMMIITPEIIKSFTELKVCNNDSITKTIDEHHEILRKIVNQDKKGAVESMELHLSDIKEFSRKYES